MIINIDVIIIISSSSRSSSSSTTTTTTTTTTTATTAISVNNVITSISILLYAHYGQACGGRFIKDTPNAQGSRKVFKLAKTCSRLWANHVCRGWFQGCSALLPPLYDYCKYCQHVYYDYE